MRYRVYTSDDNTTYDQDSHSRRFCVYGTLDADLPLTNTLDDGADGILIHFPGPDDGLDLEATGEKGRLKMRMLVFVENEIIAYRDVEIVSANSARLTGLRRGCYDTFMAAHATGTPVLMIPRRDLHVFTDTSYEKGALVYLKIATATARAMLDLGDVVETDLTLTNRTARPLPPINLRINGVGVSPTYAAGADVLIEWDAASWLRNSFWQGWEEAYVDPRLHHKVQIWSADGTTLIRVTVMPPGVSSLTYDHATLLSDFGGTAPAAFQVHVKARRRGMKALSQPVQTVSLVAAPPINPIPRTNWMYPSMMSQVLGACDPETLVDRNFALCAAHFGLSLPATAVQDDDGAPAAVQTNFTTLATALNLTLYPVSDSRDPEVAAQANFEIVNAHW